MAKKAKNIIEDKVTLSAEAVGTVTYADYFTKSPLFLSVQVKNDGAESVSDLTLTIEDDGGLVIKSVKEIPELPFESAVEISFENELSPAYFIDLKEAKEERVKLTLAKDGETIAENTYTVTALPFDFWQGFYGNVSQIACFVRPRIADCAKIRSEALAQLKKWGTVYEGEGYDGADKNTVRQTAAAVFAAIRRYSAEMTECDLTVPVAAGSGTGILSEKKANILTMSVFVSACLENFGLHPLIFLGEEEATCGVWLYDSCFMDTVSDDMQLVAKYAADGINNLSCFDVSDLFWDKSVAFSTSEKHFLQKLKAEKYEKCVDVRRCRLESLFPLPLREKGIGGYELLSEEESSPFSAPKALSSAKKIKAEGKQPKNKQWERRLLDLSMKNSLLNFKSDQSVLHVYSASPDTTLAAFSENGEMLLEARAVNGVGGKKPDGGIGAGGLTKAHKELIRIENNGGVVRTYADEPSFEESIRRLIRKSREADEESGSKILYIAYGFLKWLPKNETSAKYAPLVLQPVSLKTARGGRGYALCVSDEEPTVNSTLLEFLKREFGLDVRGLDGGLKGLKISEILAMMRMETVNMQGWDIYDDVYVAPFSFARYQMWQDVRKNMAEFSKNPIVASLLGNRSLLQDNDDVDLKEDNTSPENTLMPLPADSSQWEAVALSQTGKTFVLHGPPGTGKSQTITNMIANALKDGRRVLFVAEKQAALSVVKKRLDGIGIGDFCLELHSAKTSKAEVLQKLQSTLALAGSEQPADISEKAQAIDEIRKKLGETTASLHKRRRLGVSLYEAMLIYRKNIHAPELMNIESAFYDSLTKDKIEKYEEMIIRAATAAKECGGVYNSPFYNVNLTEFSTEKRESVYCSCEVMIAEIKHLKNYLALFLDLYRQKISVLTRRKLEILKDIAVMLDGGALKKYFNCAESEFLAFYNANVVFDRSCEYYFSRFRKLVDAGKEYEEILADIEAGKSLSENKAAERLILKLKKTAIDSGKVADYEKAVETLCIMYRAMADIKAHTSLSQNFTTAFGKTDFFDGRKKFLSDLYKLGDLAAKLFMDYNADGFFSVCIRAAGGFAKPVLKGLIRSVNSFFSSEDNFTECTSADRKKLPEEDILEYYTAKAGALIENIDMLGSWCVYRETADRLDREGLTFITDALENGAVTSENIVAGFEKNIYKNFLLTNIPSDPVLSRFSAAVTDEQSEMLRRETDDFAKDVRAFIRATLISRLPAENAESTLGAELMHFKRLAKNNLRGAGLRKLFAEIPGLLGVAAPCLLMSPVTVAQYLQAENSMFDIVIFDEASQMPTAEAIGSLARAGQAVIVGDPRQLPPTAFFNANYVDEENLENEDLESVLDDCLALGIPQRHLIWHYRSKHESLIAFSNIMYYGSKLCTFPSPDALDSRVKLVRVEDGVYDRSLTKINRAEADALVKEVVDRLKDPVKRKSSIGIVTFSSVQRDYIERKLSAALSAAGAESAAYDREEPLFVKNLENVQGDERDVIFFSVCYGPDKRGKISLNFGPINQAGGWRRLNVAVSRAREEMVVFSSMTSADINLEKTNSKGVAGLKAFLEFAEKGRTTIALRSDDLDKKRRTGIGKYIAEELSAYGYDCRYDVGVSDFKIDVAVIDPKNKHRFILAVMCDGKADFSVKDRYVLQIQTLKRNNWNVIRVYAVNYFANPKREIKKIKDMLDRLTGADKRAGAGLNRFRKVYKAAQLLPLYENSQYVTEGFNDAEIVARLKAIVSQEEPISEEFLIKRCLSSLGISKYGSKTENKMRALIASCNFKFEKLLGRIYYRKSDKTASFDRYRVEEGEPLRKTESDFTPYEVIALVRGALEDKVALYPDEVASVCAGVLRIQRMSDKFALFIDDCVSLGEERGLFVRSVSDRISLA